MFPKLVLDHPSLPKDFTITHLADDCDHFAFSCGWGNKNVLWAMGMSLHSKTMHTFHAPLTMKMNLARLFARTFSFGLLDLIHRSRRTKTTRKHFVHHPINTWRTATTMTKEADMRYAFSMLILSSNARSLFISALQMAQSRNPPCQTHDEKHAR